MSEMQIFKNEQFGEVRTIMKNDEVWFVGKDVAEALGYTKFDAMYRLIDSADKFKITPQSLDNTGFPQFGAIESNPNVKVLMLINESGLYQAVFNSQLDSAKEFKHWVTSEVLPSIRKTGMYMTPEKLQETLSNPDSLIAILTTLKEEQEKRKEEERRRIALQKEHTSTLLQLEMVEEENKTMRPQAEYANRIIHAGGLMNTTQVAADYSMSAIKLNRILSQEVHFIYKTGGQWVLYSKYKDKGYTESKTVEITNKDGSTTTRIQTRWTQKGRYKIYELMTKLGYKPNYDKDKEKEERALAAEAAKKEEEVKISNSSTMVANSGVNPEIVSVN